MTRAVPIEFALTLPNMLTVAIRGFADFQSTAARSLAGAFFLSGSSPLAVSLAVEPTASLRRVGVMLSERSRTLAGFLARLTDKARRSLAHAVRRVPLVPTAGTRT